MHHVCTCVSVCVVFAHDTSTIGQVPWFGVCCCCCYSECFACVIHPHQWWWCTTHERPLIKWAGSPPLWDVPFPMLYLLRNVNVCLSFSGYTTRVLCMQRCHFVMDVHQVACMSPGYGNKQPATTRTWKFIISHLDHEIGNTYATRCNKDTHTITHFCMSTFIAWQKRSFRPSFQEPWCHINWVMIKPRLSLSKWRLSFWQQKVMPFRVKMPAFIYKACTSSPPRISFINFFASFWNFYSPSWKSSKSILVMVNLK